MTTATRRRSRKQTANAGALLPLLIVLGVLAGLPALAELLIHALPVMLAAAAVAGIVLIVREAIRRGAGQAADVARQRDWYARQLMAVAAQRDQLARHAGELRGQLERQAAEHRAECAALAEAMHAAWDAAANARPAARRPADDEMTSPRVAAMLADPRSGVRRLGPGR